MKLIAIDGVDGSGKSYIANKLSERLCSYHLKVVKVHFPEANLDSGKSIYKMLNDKNIDINTVNPFAIWMMYAINRYSWFFKNKDCIKDAIVIADRYTMSSAVFQGVSLIDKMMRVHDSTVSNFSFDAYDKSFDISTFSKAYDMFGLNEEINTFFNGIFNMSYLDAIKFMMFFEYNVLRVPVPDFTFIINASFEEISENLKGKAKDSFESDEMFKERNRIYNYLAEKLHWIKINNNFSLTAEVEVNRIMDCLINNPIFEFIRYIDKC